MRKKAPRKVRLVEPPRKAMEMDAIEDPPVEAAGPTKLEDAMARAGVTGSQAESAAPGANTGENSSKPDDKAPISPPPPLPADPVAMGQAVMQYADMITHMTCRAYAMAARVPWTDELTEIARLSDAEKQSLAITAPAAYPYLVKLLQHSDKLGVAMFALGFLSIMASKVSSIKAKKPVPPPSPATAGLVAPGVPIASSVPPAAAAA